ncbi:MAG: hypothetical protein HY615_07665 [Candidatus Rokubacteria bacterium]|nr:hypothetical protein [Candidatus Rokubacteria bacterium]
MTDGTIGLLNVGAYVPRYRLTGKLLAQVWGGGSGERSTPRAPAGRGIAGPAPIRPRRGAGESFAPCAWR